MKDLKNLKGSKVLSKSDQKLVKGGLFLCSGDSMVACKFASWCTQDEQGNWYCS